MNVNTKNNATGETNLNRFLTLSFFILNPFTTLYNIIYFNTFLFICQPINFNSKYYSLDKLYNLCYSFKKNKGLQYEKSNVGIRYEAGGN